MEPTEEPNQPETQSEKKTKAPHRPRSKPGRKSTRARKRKAPAGSGASRLRQSINDELEKEAPKIAKTLVGKSAKGDLNCTNVVVKISGADKAPVAVKKKKHGVQPYILRLANEPKWEGPWLDEYGKRDASKLPPSDFDLRKDLK
jgi:hypothetical protein